MKRKRGKKPLVITSLEITKSSIVWVYIRMPQNFEAFSVWQYSKLRDIFLWPMEDISNMRYVFSIPIMLRIYFKHDRALLTKLCRCAYDSLLIFLQNVLKWPAAKTRKTFRYIRRKSLSRPLPSTSLKNHFKIQTLTHPIKTMARLYQKDLWGRSSVLPELWRGDEDHQLYYWPTGNTADPETPQSLDTDAFQRPAQHWSLS